MDNQCPKCDSRNIQKVFLDENDKVFYIDWRKYDWYMGMLEEYPNRQFKQAYMCLDCGLTWEEQWEEEEIVYESK